MKTIIALVAIAFSICLASETYAQATCCPDFDIQMTLDPCGAKDHATNGSGGPGGGMGTLCQNGTYTFFATPGAAGFSYYWSVSGGVIVSSNLNQVTVMWGSGVSGTITVFVTNADSSCSKLITRTIGLRPGPKASFTHASSDTVCLNTDIPFTNTSLGGATVTWNFGDGSPSVINVNNPHHIYSTLGPHIVKLTVSSSLDTSPPRVPPQGAPCVCTSVFYDTIVVVNGQSLTILDVGCKKMLCVGDTGHYCSNLNCSTYNWSALGGTIITPNPTTQKCIDIVWNPASGSPQPFVALNVPAACTGSCSNVDTLIVPVLYNGIPITGSTIVCVGSNTFYSIPTLSGALIHWTISPSGGNIITADSNNEFINVAWTTIGNYTINCSYHNPLTGCSGSTSLVVKVRPIFGIGGSTQSCATCVAGYYTMDGSVATWAVDSNGTPIPSLSSTGSSLNITFPNLSTTTVYTITATASPGHCNPTASITTTVYPLPILSMITGPSPICPGSTQTYTITSNTPGVPINWTVNTSNGGTGGTIIASGPYNSSAQVTFTGSDTIYIITAMQPCKAGCAFATRRDTVHMIPAPGPISGPSPACMDNTAVYTIPNYVAGSTYTWVITPSGAGTIISGQGSGSVTILWHGSNGGPQPVLTVSNCAGSSPAYPVTIVTVQPVTIQQTGSLCTGLTLTAVTGGPVTGYLWSNNATGSSITVNTGGTYTVTVNEGGCNVSASVTISSTPLGVTIATGRTVFCPTEPISAILQTIVTPTAVGATYSWSPGGQSTSTITALATGTYTVTVTLGTCVATASITISRALTCPPDTCVGCSGNLGTLVINTPSNNATVCNPAPFKATFTQGSYATFSSIQWNFGDTYTGTSLSGQTITHTYANIGVYHVTASVLVTCSNPPLVQCRVFADIYITIPSVTHFDTIVGCSSVKLIDHSVALSGDPITTWNWSSSPSVTFIPNNTTQNPTFVGIPGNTYTITLTTTTTSGCVTTESKTITIPNVAPPVFTLPATTCSGVQVFPTLTAVSGATYHWDFGDGFTSNLPPPAIPPVEHAFINNTASPVVYTVKLVVTYANGCTDSTTHTITVNPLPHATVTPNPTSICPGTTTTLTATATGGPATFVWYVTGNVNPLGSLPTLTVTQFGHYYVIVTNTATGCTNSSDTAIVLLKQAPIAHIVGSSAICYGGMNPPTLSNIYFITGNTYSWSSSAPSVISFSPASSNTQASTQLTFTNPTNVSYQIYLSVFDPVTGCTSYDTLCIFPNKTPTGSISTIQGNGCAGQINTFVAVMTPPPSMSVNYAYQWSTGETTDTISTTVEGLYSCIVTNTLTGCSVTLGPVLVWPLTDLSLFPRGCLTICNTDSIGLPLPIFTGSPGNALYTVQWFDGTNPTPIYTGWQIPPLLLSIGLHHLHVKVTGPSPNNNCPDTAGYFDVTIKQCNCKCDGHKITNLQYAIGPKEYSPMKCGGEISIHCDSLKITADFNCDSGCTKKLYATLVNAGGVVVQTWPTLPVLYFPPPGTSGSFTIHIYGKCDETICDSCILHLTIDCHKDSIPPCEICPPGLKKAINITLTPQAIVLDSIAGSPFNNLPVGVTINTGTTQLTQVIAQVVSYDLKPSYEDCITCDNKPAGWTSITGQPLAGITPINGGIAILPPMNNAYVNPREVVWQSVSPFVLNTGSTTINIYLPALANVPCCTLTGKICIKFSFRDVNCKVCDTIICFDFGKPVDVGCDCGKWRGITLTQAKNSDARMAVINPGNPGNGTTLNCEGSMSVKYGTSWSFNAGFACSDPKCTPSYKWTVFKNGTSYSSGAGAQGTLLNLQPGKYVITYAVTCGGKTCPGCSITLNVTD